MFVQTSKVPRTIMSIALLYMLYVRYEFVLNYDPSVRRFDG